MTFRPCPEPTNGLVVATSDMHPLTLVYHCDRAPHGYLVVDDVNWPSWFEWFSTIGEAEAFAQSMRAPPRDDLRPQGGATSLPDTSRSASVQGAQPS